MNLSGMKRVRGHPAALCGPGTPPQKRQWPRPEGAARRAGRWVPQYGGAGAASGRAAFLLCFFVTPKRFWSKNTLIKVSWQSL